MEKQLLMLVLSEFKSIRREHDCGYSFSHCEDCKLIKERIRQLEIIIQEYFLETKEDLK